MMASKPTGRQNFHASKTKMRFYLHIALSFIRMSGKHSNLIITAKVTCFEPKKCQHQATIAPYIVALLVLWYAGAGWPTHIALS